MIWWNEEAQTPQKCIFCAHLLDEGWKKTRCSQVCPTGSLSVVQIEDADMEKLVQQEGLKVLHPEYKTKPRVYYKNLFRYDRCFIGGSLAVELKGQTECAEGAKVTLMAPDGKKLAETTADTFGDFKFDGLEENTGLYTLEIEYQGRDKKTVTVELTASVNAGTINL